MPAVILEGTKIIQPWTILYIDWIITLTHSPQIYYLTYPRVKQSSMARTKAHFNTKAWLQFVRYSVHRISWNEMSLVFFSWLQLINSWKWYYRWHNNSGLRAELRIPVQQCSCDLQQWHLDTNTPVSARQVLENNFYDIKCWDEEVAHLSGLIDLPITIAVVHRALYRKDHCTKALSLRPLLWI